MGKPLPISRARSVAVTAKGRASFAVLLLDGFSHLALAGALETLAAANDVANRPVYGWSTVTLDGKPARGSAGLEIAPDTAIDALPRNAVLMVIGGRHIGGDPLRRVIGLLRREVAHGRQLVGISDAITIMAEAGVLAGQSCAVHWRDAPSFAERFPDLDICASAFVQSRHSTISGCIATADFFLDRIRADLGRAVAQAVADRITHRSMRDGDAPQTASQTCRIGDRNTTVLRIVQAMEANIATPLTVSDLATRANVSTRQMERQFLRIFGTTPLRYYLRLRLERARDLLVGTDMPLTDIAELSGFAGVQILSRQYRKTFGLSPSDRGRIVPPPQDHQDANERVHALTSNTLPKGTEIAPSLRTLTHTRCA